MTTDYLDSKVLVHTVANLLILSIYAIFMALLVNCLFEIKNFDQTTEQSYMLKSLSVFMVATTTVL